MKIIYPITVKQILTENSKEKLIHKWQAKKEEMKRECDQLYFQLKKAEKNNKKPVHHFPVPSGNQQKKGKNEVDGI